MSEMVADDTLVNFFPVNALRNAALLAAKTALVYIGDGEHCCTRHIKSASFRLPFFSAASACAHDIGSLHALLYMFLCFIYAAISAQYSCLRSESAEVADCFSSQPLGYFMESHWYWKPDYPYNSSDM